MYKVYLLENKDSIEISQKRKKKSFERAFEINNDKRGVLLFQFYLKIFVFIRYFKKRA